MWHPENGVCVTVTGRAYSRWSRCWQSSRFIDLRASEQGDAAASSRHSAGLLCNLCFIVCARAELLIKCYVFIPLQARRRRAQAGDDRRDAFWSPVGYEASGRKMRAQGGVTAHAGQHEGLPGGMWQVACQVARWCALVGLLCV